MGFTFDPEKDEINFVKHGAWLSETANLDWSAAMVMEDLRAAYGEMREIGYAPMGERLYCVVFTRRGDVLRIISLRKANSREVSRYDDQT